MRKKGHIQQNIEGIGQRHQDGEGRCPWEEHQSARYGLEEANPENQITGRFECHHESTDIIRCFRDGVAVDGKSHRHEPGAKKKQCEEYPHDDRDTGESNGPLFVWQDTSPRFS